MYKRQHLTSSKARVLAHYASEFYAGTPAVVENSFGKGQAWYVGTRLDHDGLSQVIDRVVEKTYLKRLCTEKTDLEITRRVRNGQELYFVLNMRNEARPLPVELQQAGFIDILTQAAPKARLKPWDVEILKRTMTD